MMSTSQNGWPVLTSSAGCDNRAVGAALLAPGIRAGDVATVLRYVATQFNAHVEALHAGWCWGYNYRTIRGQTTGFSNHASATAIDLNAPSHPRQSSNRYAGLTTAQVAAVHSILAALGGVVRWGGDYHTAPYDPMHFEINADAAAVHVVAQRLTAPPKPPGGKVIEGIDYAWGYSPGSGLKVKAAGKAFIIRYLDFKGNSKDIVAAEYKETLADGLGLGLVWEASTGDFQAGFNGGVTHAKAANAELATIPGVDVAHTTVFAAIDTDASSSSLQALAVAYLKGWASVRGHDYTGLYGGYGAVRACMDAKACKYAWQTYAWSGGTWDARAMLRQYSNNHTVAGISCDYDQALQADCGILWPSNSPYYTGGLSVADITTLTAAIAALNTRVTAAATRQEDINKRQEALFAGVAKSITDFYNVMAGRYTRSEVVAKSITDHVDKVPADTWAEAVPAAHPFAVAVAELSADQDLLRANVERLLALLPADVAVDAPVVDPNP